MGVEVVLGRVLRQVPLKEQRIGQRRDATRAPVRQGRLMPTSRPSGLKPAWAVLRRV